MVNWIEQIDKCTECDQCMGVCPTYKEISTYKAREKTAWRKLIQD